MTAPDAVHPGLREVLSGPHRRVWRYLVPSSSLDNVLVLGDILGLDALAAAREATRVCTVAPDASAADRIRERAATESVSNLDVAIHRTGSPTDSLPFEDGRFDLVILPDYGRDWGLRSPLDVTLSEIYRVMRPGGYLYMTSDNRLRSGWQGLTLPRFRRAVKAGGFQEARWFGAFPSASEPKHLADLAGSTMEYLFSAYLNLDIRRGGMVRWCIRCASKTGISAHIAPGYVVLCRKGGE